MNRILLSLILLAMFGCTSPTTAVDTGEQPNAHASEATNTPNPCDENNGGCGENAQCTSQGSEEPLCTCKPGFLYNAEGVCVPTPACQFVICEQHSHCEEGACVCDEGYEAGTEGSCVDIDECLRDNGGCGDAAFWECTNLDGGSSCADIDECAIDNGGCGDNAQCTNQAGESPLCTCKPGFLYNAEGVCVPTPSCQFVVCEQHSHCEEGACVCDHGYMANGEDDCVDVDECLIDNGGCGDNSICTNVAGAEPTCTCEAGYALVDGSCFLMSELCGEGTILIDGECVLVDSDFINQADVQESAEPNLEVGTAIELAPLGESRTLYGCVTPYEDADNNASLDPDWDRYIFVVDAPALIRIKVDGLYGLAGGFAIRGGDEEPTALMNSNWVRFGLAHASDTAERQVFLPSAGTYHLDITDSTTISSGFGFGSSTTCYYATLNLESMPEPKPLSPASEGAPAGTLGSASGPLGIDIYRFTVVDDDSFIMANAIDGSETTQAGLSIVDASLTTFYGASGLGQWDSTAVAAALDVDEGQELLVVVDTVISQGSVSTDYTLDVVNAGFTLPRDGATAVVTGLDRLAERGIFEVFEDHSVVHLQASYSSAAGVMYVVDSQSTMVAEICSSCAATDTLIYFEKAGSYALVLSPLDNADDGSQDGISDYELTATLKQYPVTELSLGVASPMTAVPQEGLFYRVSILDWITMGFDLSDFAGTLDVDIWNGIVPQSDPISRTGVLGAELPLLEELAADANFIELDAQELIIRVKDQADVPSETAAAALTVDERVYTVVELSGTGKTELEIASFDQPQYFLFRAPPGEYYFDLTVSATDAAPLIERLDEKERIIGSWSGDAGVARAEVQMSMTQQWVAIRISASGDAAMIGSGAVAINSVAPVTYSVTPMSVMPIADVCINGTEAVLLADQTGFGAPDEALAVASLGDFAFKFFGFDVSELTISSNGFISFDSITSADYTADPVSTAFAPNNIIAAYWTDWHSIKVCYHHDTVTNTFVVEWYDGMIYGNSHTGRFQLVLDGDDNSVMTLIDPENSTVDGTTATGVSWSPPVARVESPTGNRGTAWFVNAPQDFSLNNAAKYIPQWDE